eukprot:COSAG05_NODE_1558_length_4564_cov_5.087794_8_plen_28_part_01
MRSFQIHVVIKIGQKGTLHAFYMHVPCK